MAWSHRFLRLLFLAGLLLTDALTAVCALPDYELRLVQVLHRHGARSPIVSYNATAICGTEYPCGYLNKPGQAMLRNVGAFLRERYQTDRSVVDPSAPFLTNDAYNTTVSYSRSTDVLRTLQSSVALLHGLFPDMDAYYPAVHTIDTATDSLLFSDSIPMVRAKRRYGRPELEVQCLPVLDNGVPDFGVLLDVAREVHSEGYCSAPADRLLCALSLCDIGLAYEATGDLKRHGRLKANLARLCAAAECTSRFFFTFNSSDPVQAMQGSVGQTTAQEMIGNMRKAVESAGGTGFRFYEYSAHDTTVAPLSATFGDDSALGMMPPFAATFIVELLAKKRPKGGGGGATRRKEGDLYDYYVRVVRGHPGVTPESRYVFGLTPFDMRCLSARGETYVAEGNVCPLEDFVRFVDASRPRSEAGVCWIDPVLYARMGCPVTGAPLKGHTAREDELSNDCLHFRMMCPAYACQEGYDLSAVDYGCYRTQRKPSHWAAGTGAASAAVVAVVAFSAGVAAGLGSLLLRRFCEQRRRRQGYVSPCPSPA